MKAKKYLLAVVAIIAGCVTAMAKDYDIALSSNPDGAVVYMNGQKVCDMTPAIIRVPDKIAKNIMIFKFVKDGYESQSVTVSYDKKQLKHKPVVYCQLKAKPKKENKQYTADPTVSKAQARQRVDRSNAGKTDMEKTILRWFFDSDPRGARIFYRVISSAPNEVKNTNETFLTTTPYEETRSFNIQGLTYDNSRDVTIEIRVSKRGYENQVKRFNVRQALDQQEISGFFELVKKDTDPADDGN